MHLLLLDASVSFFTLVMDFNLASRYNEGFRCYLLQLEREQNIIAREIIALRNGECTLLDNLKSTRTHTRQIEAECDRLSEEIQKLARGGGETQTCAHQEFLRTTDVFSPPPKRSRYVPAAIVRPRSLPAPSSSGSSTSVAATAESDSTSTTRLVAASRPDTR